LLPEQVRGIQFHPDMGDAGQLDQFEDVGGVEHQVLRVQLQRDLDVQIGGELVDLLPERDGDRPLVVQHVQRGGVPGVDDPVRPGRARLPARKPGHGDDPVLAEPVGQPDRPADVLGVLVADGLVGMQRVSVAVQPGDGHPGALEDAQVVVPGGVAEQDLVDGRDVRRGQ